MFDRLGSLGHWSSGSLTAFYPGSCLNLDPLGHGSLEFHSHSDAAWGEHTGWQCSPCNRRNHSWCERENKAWDLGLSFPKAQRIRKWKQLYQENKSSISCSILGTLKLKREIPRLIMWFWFLLLKLLGSWISESFWYVLIKISMQVY